MDREIYVDANAYNEVYVRRYDGDHNADEPFELTVVTNNCEESVGMTKAKMIETRDAINKVLSYE